jgi:hypothetical protein
MENAVPIVTQAPGAQPLQIQTGLLTQVGSSDVAVVVVIRGPTYSPLIASQELIMIAHLCSPAVHNTLNLFYLLGDMNVSLNTHMAKRVFCMLLLMKATLEMSGCTSVSFAYISVTG